MSKVILHHYPLSPYSEKIRLALGLKGVSWNSVEIPVWTPRPKLTPMTGGYRRTPILQVGAEFYCDTLHILRAIEELGTSGSLYPKGQEGLAKALGWWIEKGSFMNAVCLTIGNMPGLPQELIDERRPLFRVNLDPEVLRPKRAMYLQRVNAHIAWLAEVLADGRKFIFGDDPSRGRFVGLSSDLVCTAEWGQRDQRADRFRRRDRPLVQESCRHWAWQILRHDPRPGDRSCQGQ